MVKKRTEMREITIKFTWKHICVEMIKARSNFCIKCIHNDLLLQLLYFYKTFVVDLEKIGLKIEKQILGGGIITFFSFFFPTFWLQKSKLFRVQ